jgi:hypothetical protein
MNSNLAQQQQELAAAIRADSALTSNLLQATPQGTPARLHIYSNAYRARLGEALKENYPVLARVLGDDGFIDLSAAFLHSYPSRTPSIRWFGAALAEFVEQNTDALPHPSLCDLIRMEWALNTAFDGADANPLKVADMLTIAPQNWPTLRFAAHPTLHLLAMNWNVEPLWTALSADENADTEPPEELQHHLLIWRYEHKTQWRSVAPMEAQLLQATIAGDSFTELCETAAGITDTATAETVAGYLRTWIESGLLVRFKP